METISRSLLTFLLNSLWQVPVAVAVAALACRCMRHVPASHRHAVWVAALAASVLLPVASMRTASTDAVSAIRRVACGRPRRRIPQPEGLSSRRTLPHRYRFPEPSRWPPPPRPYCWAGYLLFVLYRLCRLAWASLRTVQIRRAARSIDLPDTLDRVRARCEDAFGLSGVGLLVSRAGSGSGHGGAGDHPSGVPAGGAERGRAHDRHRSRNGAHRAARLRLQSVVRSAPTADRFSSGRLADSSRDRADSRNGLR